MPELEELPADEELQEVSVQNMVDRIEGHPHGHTIAKQTAEPQDETRIGRTSAWHAQQFAKLHKQNFARRWDPDMPPKRRDQTNKNKEVDNMPELEELPADEELQEVSVQNMVDRIEGHPHGHTIAKQTAEPQDEILEKNVVEMEEASKMMAEGILAYVKAVVSHTTQSSSQGSFEHKGAEQGVGSSRAGEARRSVPTHPAL
ncbi:hypothetical protein F511_31050 [Dorcoceras hygrometricum]|uniref:Uncharacterized protein n=1 Tax=Dorcoceras hygrometricum TaxID=472368 RepID=A0A2Z7BNL6_9LAMI|nr:hypothetical protein F511_31050 [Dorcoceras hygrometricum]